MAKKNPRKAKRRVPKTVLRLPDLEQAKSAVLDSLSSIDAQRDYRHAIEEFVPEKTDVSVAVRFLETDADYYRAEAKKGRSGHRLP